MARVLIAALQNSRYFSTGSAFKVSMLSVQSHSKNTANMTEKGQRNTIYLCRLWQGLLEHTAVMQLLPQSFSSHEKKTACPVRCGEHPSYSRYFCEEKTYVCISSLPNMPNTQSINEQVYTLEDLFLLRLYMINPKSPRNPLLRIWSCFAKFQCFRYQQEHWFFPSLLWLLAVLWWEAGKGSKTKDALITFY